MTTILDDLRDKHERKVKQVRVTTMIAALEESASETERLRADLAQAKKALAQAQRALERAGDAPLSGADLANALAAARGSNPVTYQDGTEVKGVLLGTAEVAAVLGVERPRIGKWRAIGRIPEPMEDLAATPVWLREQIEPLRAEALAGRRGERRLEVADEVAETV